MAFWPGTSLLLLRLCHIFMAIVRFPFCYREDLATRKVTLFKELNVLMELITVSSISRSVIEASITFSRTEYKMN